MDNKNEKNKFSIIKKVDEIILNFLDGYPPIIQTVARIIVFGGLIIIAIIIAKVVISLLIPAIGTILASLFLNAFVLLLIAGFIYDVKLNMTRDENSFLLNERLKYQKKEYEERERRRQEENNRK